MNKQICLLGEIKNNHHILSDAGKMVHKNWEELEYRYTNIKLHDFIVMPNHFHGIIEIIDTSICRGKPCVCPESDQIYTADTSNKSDKPHELNKSDKPNEIERVNTRFTPTGGKFVYSKNSIARILQDFKSRTTLEYIKNISDKNWKNFYKKLWQKNYYEHIIRSENAYHQISDYIENNPYNWESDRFYISELS